MLKIKSVLCSHLAKIFPDSDPAGSAVRTGSALRGEKFSFQFAYFVENDRPGNCYFNAQVTTKLKNIRIRRVDLSPVKYLAHAFDEDVLSTKPGLYPDPLLDFSKPFRTTLGQWNALWIDIPISKNCKPGKYQISIKAFISDMPEIATEKTFTLEVMKDVLPPQTLVHTEWFHADCLATYYRIPVWSRKHWRIIENHMRAAAEHGINMLLTPVFTPPLDTAVGGERPTVQLVGVTLKNRHYTFDFSKLERWIRLAQKAGIEYFEISHLFTQWGAAYSPKIVATVKGKEQRIFGWDVESTSAKYRNFLNAFLPQLADFLTEHGLKDKTYFHCSDEPHLNHLPTYKKAVTLLRKHLAGFKMCDALSNLDYYTKGLVSTPIPAENHIEPFVKAGVSPLWTYYCCTQVVKCSNRMLHMPSSRNRIMGSLLYRYDIAGFLQWGFNFYHSQFSEYPIDPWSTVDSGCAFPAGDPFMVYPGWNGEAVDSIRLEVFFQGLQDLRALRLLEARIGRDKVVAMLDKLTPGGRMTMEEYPRGEKAVLALRRKINDMLKKSNA